MSDFATMDNHSDLPSMRILFVSGVGVGGAPRSTVELARKLADRGHQVEVLLGSREHIPRVFDLGVRSLVKIGTRPGAHTLRRGLRRFGRESKRHEYSDDRVSVWIATLSENAALPLIDRFSPDVVIANSFAREQFKWLLEDLAARGIPSVLYIRESHALTHLTLSGAHPDLVIANAEQYANEVRHNGLNCTFAPSIVDCTAVTVESKRTAVLMVNPVAENRPEILTALADARPDIHCVWQESWPLPEDVRCELAEVASSRRNLEFRVWTSDVSQVYLDAKLVLATYPSGRPRVVPEAQHNGIPIVALDQPALTEAVGDGGELLPPAESVDLWVSAITSIWDDPDRYLLLSEASRRHASRPEINPELIVTTVEDALRSVVR